jgi:hypothetical protein
VSFGKALYFPYIHFQDENWLKYSLLYWDAIKRIVPRSYQPKDSKAVAVLSGEGMVEDVDPQAGATPYTEGAAEEFVPTIEELIKTRGRLGRGASIAKSVEANARDSLVHLEKMDLKVHRILTGAGLAQVDGDWMMMQKDLAGYYMLCLAAHISEKQNAPLLSDSYEMETGGTFFQHSRLLPRDNRKDGDIGFRLARMILPVARPGSLSRIATNRFIRFHRKYEPERMQFREAIEKATQGVAQLTDPSAIRDFLEKNKKTIKNALRDQRKIIEELKIGVVDSLLSVSVPGVVAGALTRFDPIQMALGSSAGLAVSMISWYVKARGERRRAIRDSDWHYLLRLEKHFKLKEVAEEGRNWFQQFIND